MTRQSAISYLKAISYIGIYGGLLMPLVFIPYVIFPFVFSKLIAFQILIGLTFPAYLFLTWVEPRFRPGRHLLYFALAAYLAAIGLSVVFAIDPARAWWGNQERMNGLFTILHFFAWLSMAVGLLKTWDQWKRILNYEVALSAFMAIVALLQKVNPNLLAFPAGPRVGGLLDNPIYMGAYQIFNLAFLVLLAMKTRSWKLWTWYAAIGFVDIVAFMLAQSRGDLLGLAAGVISFALFFGIFTKAKKVRFAILTVVAVLFATYGVLFSLRDQSFIQGTTISRFLSFSGSVSTRLIAWKIAWGGFVERPLTGWGFDNFHILFNQNFNPQSLRFGTYETWFDRAHNTVLDVLSMTGIFGFLTFFAVFGTLFYAVWRAYRKQWIDLSIASILIALTIAYFIQNLFVFDHPAGFSMSYLLFAFVIAATTKGFMENIDISKAETANETKHDFSAIAYGIVMVLALLLVWRTSVIPFKASRLSLMANSAFGSPQGLAYAKEAAALWTPYLDEQTFLLSRNLITIAGQTDGLKKIYQWEEWFNLAKQLSDVQMQNHPRDTHSSFIYARLLQDMARMKPELAPQAEQWYKKSIDTSPMRQQLHYALANLYYQYGKIDEALVVYQRVSEFDPNFGDGYWIYGVATFYDAHKPAQGAPIIMKALTVSIPYNFRDVNELAAVADAAFLLNTPEAYNVLIASIKRAPKGSAMSYAQLAYKFDQAKLTDVRDRILDAAEEISPMVRSTFEDLKKSPPTSNTITNVPAPATPPPTNQVATTNYSGLRIKK
jgi:O-antigen ligase